MTKSNSHRKALEKIAANPSKFGFKDIIAIAIEVNLFDERGRQVVQPDMILYDKGNVWIVEYKNNGDEELRKRAQEQLYHAVEWFSKYTNINPRTRIIDGTQYPELKRIR